MLFVFLFAALGAGLPLQNTTAKVEKVGWAQAPQTRGTFDLLLSCLTTLSLCAWTAYHPNIHFARSGWSRWAHRLSWMLIAVFVPEVVLWCACDQWWAARKLKRTINGLIEQRGTESKDAENKETCGLCDQEPGQEHREDEESCGEHPPRTTTDLASTAQFPFEPKASLEAWTMEQAFFALSGGFALPSPGPSRPPRPLTPIGIVLLFELGILPHVEPTTISDKSKADGIAKALVCIQAGWFFLQCIARAAKQLPITVLEIHVLAHVLCAFAIYAVWFKKGYDVGTPILVEGEVAKVLGALFALDAGPVRSNLISVAPLFSNSHSRDSVERHLASHNTHSKCRSPAVGTSTIWIFSAHPALHLLSFLTLHHFTSTDPVTHPQESILTACSNMLTFSLNRKCHGLRYQESVSPKHQRWRSI